MDHKNKKMCVAERKNIYLKKNMSLRGDEPITIIFTLRAVTKYLTQYYVYNEHPQRGNLF